MPDAKRQQNMLKHDHTCVKPYNVTQYLKINYTVSVTHRLETHYSPHIIVVTDKPFRSRIVIFSNHSSLIKITVIKAEVI